MNKLRVAIDYLLNDRNRFLDSLITHFNFLFPDKTYLSIRYRLNMGYWMNWNRPQTFSEKIQWLKVFGNRPEYTRMVDKISAKEYAASLIGEKYIIPTIGVWNKTEEIDWDALPEKFVLKTTHGGGSTGVVICKDKKSFDKDVAIRKLKASLEGSAGEKYREHPYDNVPRKIIAEKLLFEVDLEGNYVDKELTDYKFFCFNGEPKYCQIIRDRHTKETIDFYDMEWNLMPFVGLNPVASNGITPVAKPLHLEELKNLCRKLSQGVPFVRVDMYVINDKEYFGELTFYPASGFGAFSPMKWNQTLGDLIDI